MSTATTMRDALVCDDAARRSALASADLQHGIDYLEVVTAPPADNQRLLDLFFVPKASAAGTADLAAMLADLDGNPGAVRIDGGTRERNLRVLDVTHLPAPGGGRLRVRVDRPGDFSEYVLRLAHPRLDVRHAAVWFSFKAGCPSRFDCRVQRDCPPPQRHEPRIDYLAKDYASLRRALLDFAPSLIPDWQERHEADLGMALIELFAYVGDHLSYYQDAVANEAYLQTARSRISVRRHARLLDYRMHDGASARCFMHFEAAGPGTVPAGIALLTRIEQALPGSSVPPGRVIPAPLAAAALQAEATVFETITAVRVDPRANRIALYTWGDQECCLMRGATETDLVGDLTGVLAPGDFLLFEEVLGPASGAPADADPAHRQVVRLTQVTRSTDRLLGTGGAAPPAAVTHVQWGLQDALDFPLCLSARLPGGALVAEATVARGNLALADHGRSHVQWFPQRPAPGAEGVPATERGLRLRLARGPVAQAYPLTDASSTSGSARQLQLRTPEDLERQVDPCRLQRHGMTPRVEVKVHAAGISTPFGARPDLLDAEAFDPRFVVECEDDGSALLRFGDGVFGAAVPAGAFVEAHYRVGLGPQGNLGRDALWHAIEPGAVLPALASLRNPLPAWGGTAPQPIEQVKRLAPPSIHARQYRAVTEADYARAAESHPAVAKAAATFRWTGSWLTVFVTVDPRGGQPLDATARASVLDWVRCQTQAGYDLALDAPRYVPLQIELQVCVRPGYFRTQVEQALQDRLSARRLADGSLGFFHPDAFSFAEPLYLSRLYAAADAVEGVESLRVTRAQRFGELPNQELERGLVPAGRLEIIRLDNDRNRPENGVLTLLMLGGA